MLVGPYPKVDSGQVAGTTAAVVIEGVLATLCDHTGRGEVHGAVMATPGDGEVSYCSEYM
jgi:hypothetical protein